VSELGIDLVLPTDIAVLLCPSAFPRKEFHMTKVLKCSDVNPGCNIEIRGNSEDEVPKKAAEHAKTAQNMQNMCPESS
jgi:predicted small metal-binding protein